MASFTKTLILLDFVFLAPKEIQVPYVVYPGGSKVCHSHMAVLTKDKVP